MLAVMACCKGHDLQGQDHLQEWDMLYIGYTLIVGQPLDFHKD